MGEPVAWIDYSSDGTTTTWYVDPVAEGYLSEEEASRLIPMYEGWEDRLNAFKETLSDNEDCRILADGEYEAFVKPPPPPEPVEPRTTWNDLADAAREGVNSV